MRPHERRELAKTRVQELSRGRWQSAGGRRDGLRVAVDREHASFSTHGLEDARTVAAATERGIDIEAARP